MILDISESHYDRNGFDFFTNFDPFNNSADAFMEKCISLNYPYDAVVAVLENDELTIIRGINVIETIWSSNKIKVKREQTKVIIINVINRTQEDNDFIKSFIAQKV